MTGFSATVRQVIYRREDGWCARCPLCRGTQIHHRRPRGMGGNKEADTNQPSNGLLLCSACHDWIESQRSEAYKHGWLVGAEQTPAEIPVLYRGVWVTLDDRGNMWEVESD